MARAETVETPAGVVTELTNSDVTGNISFLHVRGETLQVIGTFDDTTPSTGDFTDKMPFEAGDGWIGKPISRLFGDIPYVRLFGYSVSGAFVTVYHR